MAAVGTAAVTVCERCPRRSHAAAAGIDIARVDAAVDTALAGYAEARVPGFMGVLVERDVRSALRLRQVSAATPVADTDDHG